MNTDMKKLINVWLLLITLGFSACGSSQSPDEPIFSETQTEKPVALNEQPQSPQIKVDAQTEPKSAEILEREQIAQLFPIHRLRPTDKKELPSLKYIKKWKPFCDRLARHFYEAEKFAEDIGYRERSCKDIDTLATMSYSIFKVMHLHPDYVCWIQESEEDINSGTIGKFTKANIRSRLGRVTSSALSYGLGLRCNMEELTHFVRNDLKNSLPPPDPYPYVR